MAKSAIGIKKLYYGSVITATTQLSTAGVAVLISSSNEISNVHQDTWELTEDDATQETYKNQLTKAVYRTGSKEMGDITVNFSVGQYDWDTKAALLGGSSISETDTKVGWKRGRGAVSLTKSLIAITEDNIAIVFPKVEFISSESAVDGAIAIKMSAKVLEPEQTYLSSEYWFDYTPAA